MQQIKLLDQRLQTKGSHNMTDTKPIRAYATDLHINVLGAFDLNVDAVPARRSLAKPKLVTIDPDIDEPTRLPQVYLNEDTGKTYVLGDMDRAREVDGVLHRVSEEEIEALKESVLPPGEATVTPYLATEVEAVTQPGGTIYWLRPKLGKAKRVLDSQAKTYALLTDMLTDTSKAWIMEMTLRGEQKMFRLMAWQGRLMIMELIRPGEFNEIPPVEYEYDGRLLTAIHEAADAQVKPFNPDEFLNFYRDRVAALDEAKRNGEELPAASPTAAVEAAEDDDEGLLALLAGVAAEAKKPAKRTRKSA